MNAKMGIPFWLSAFINEHGTQTLLLLIPLLSILVPLIHYVPMAYKWVVRRRLLHWYKRLTALENSLAMDAGNMHLADKATELNSIESAVSRISVPLHFSDQMYDLRGHIDLVWRRLLQRASEPAQSTT